MSLAWRKRVRRITARTPWWFKVVGKLVLSCLPVPRAQWRQWGILATGRMLDPNYALGVFNRHYARVAAHLGAGYSILELGPGDSLATAPIAAARGAGRVWLVDAGLFASLDIGTYRPLLQQLAGAAQAAPGLSVAQMLHESRATYLVEGLHSLRALPYGSVDWIFSHAVLEHIPREEFRPTIGELYRVQRAGGVSSHWIELDDHLAQGLNSLRFSSAVWESPSFRRSGFYTNRLRASQIVAAFQAAGYHILSREDNRWPALPLQRRKLHPDFARFSDDDLLVSGFELVLQKP